MARGKDIQVPESSRDSMQGEKKNRAETKYAYRAKSAGKSGNMEEKERKIRTLLWEAFLNSKGFFQKLFRYVICFQLT